MDGELQAGRRNAGALPIVCQTMLYDTRCTYLVIRQPSSVAQHEIFLYNIFANWYLEVPATFPRYTAILHLPVLA